MATKAQPSPRDQLAQLLLQAQRGGPGGGLPGETPQDRAALQYNLATSGRHSYAMPQFPTLPASAPVPTPRPDQLPASAPVPTPNPTPNPNAGNPWTQMNHPLAPLPVATTPPASVPPQTLPASAPIPTRRPGGLTIGSIPYPFPQVAPGTSPAQQRPSLYQWPGVWPGVLGF